MSDSMQPRRRQPTRLPCPWDSPGKNTGVGCHFLLQCVKVKVKSLSHIRLLASPWTAAYQASRPWDFLGESTRVGCHCPLQYICIKYGKQPKLVITWWMDEQNVVYSYIFARNLQRNRTNKRLINTDKDIDKDSYRKELTQVIVEAENSQDLWLASWRPRRADGVVLAWELGELKYSLVPRRAKVSP